jgi:hypothetical protein
MGHLQSIRVIAASTSCAVLLSACVDLSAANGWAETSTQATQFQEIVTTYVDTPERLARYAPDVTPPWKDLTEPRKQQGEALGKILKGVSEYMSALATLSADGTVEAVGKGIDGLGGKVASIQVNGKPVVKKETATAVGGLVKTISTAVLNGWKSRQVEKFIVSANPDIQIILKSELMTIVDKDFRADLKIEASEIDRYYENLIRLGSGSDAANAALSEWQILRVAENAKRVAAVDAYVKLLGKIAAGHQALAEHEGDLDDLKIVKLLFGYVKDMQTHIKVLIKA